MEKLLQQILKEITPTEEERKGKFKSDYWSTDRTIEILNLMEKNDKQYNDLMDLKSKRNKGIAHGKKVEIKKDDADKCFNVAFLFLKEKIEVAK